jgi:SSS family solute:Na+ symporter
MFIGTALFVFYTLNPGLLPNDLLADEVFPLYIMNELPVGVTGLIVAALLATAFSSLDSELNSISAVLTEDYYGKIKKRVSDDGKLRFGKSMVVVVGLFTLLMATFYTIVGNEGALEVVFTLYAIFSGGIAGMFILGLVTKRANKKGLYVGIAVCVLFTGYAVLTSTSVNDRLILDLGDWNFRHHKFMLGVYSHIIIFVVGYLASFLFKKSAIDANLTVYGWLSKRS